MYNIRNTCISDNIIKQDTSSQTYVNADEKEDKSDMLQFWNSPINIEKILYYYQH